MPRAARPSKSPGSSASSSPQKVSRHAASAADGEEHDLTLQGEEVPVANEEEDQGGKADEVEEDEEEEEEEEYEVEKVVDHKKGRGATKYLLKWKGYPDSDNTWEDEKGLDHCHDLILAYWETKKKTSASSTPQQSKKRSKPAAAASTTKSASKEPAQRRKKPKTQEEPVEDEIEEDVELPSFIIDEHFVPPPASEWEDQVAQVVSVEETGDGLMCVLQWQGGEHTEHSTKLIRENCPRKLVDFYEARLRFTNNE